MKRTVAAALGFALLVGPLVATQALAAAPAPAAASKAGYLDPSFMGGKGYRVLPTPGWVTQDLGSRWAAEPLALALGPGNGTRTVVGYAEAACSSGYSAVVRGWSANGWLDHSFYSGQARCFEVRSGRTLRSIIVRSDSSIRAAFALRGASGPPRHEFRDYAEDGRLSAVTPYNATDPQETNYPPTGDPMALRRDGAARQCEPGPKNAELNTTSTLARWAASGSRLASVDLDLLNCREYAVDRHDTVFVAGGFADEDSTTITVARLSSDGALDATFGVGGYAEVELPVGSLSPPRIFRAAIAPDSVGGVYVAVTLGGVAIAHLDDKGAIDSSFGTRVLGPAGSALTDGQLDLVAMVADTKGPIVSLVGDASFSDVSSPSPPYRLVRLRAVDGALDPSWGSGGVVTTSDPTVKMVLDGAGDLVALNGGDSQWSRRADGTRCTGCPVKLVRRLT